MPQYIGFSTLNACQPRSNNIQIDSMSTSYIAVGPNGLTPINGYGVTSGLGSTITPIYSGKKFLTIDEQLVITDFINALNIPRGQKVGQPGFGTGIWDYIFEPNTPDLQLLLENDIRRIAANDPRIDINYLKSYTQENGILLEIQMAILPFNNPQTLSVFFNSQTNSASLV